MDNNIYRSRWFYVGMAGGVLLLLALGLRLFGYELTLSGIQKRQLSEINVLVTEPGSDVYLNNRKHTTTETADEVVTLDGLKRDIYTILVAKEGHWPWTKSFEILEDGVTVDLPTFTVRQNAQIEPFKDTAESTRYEQLLTQATIPDAAHKILSPDGQIALWVDAGADASTIFLEWHGDQSKMPQLFCPNNACHNVAAAFYAETPIRSVGFYRGRSDSALVAIGSAIYAVELNPSEPQNFQPVFTGTSPRFVAADSPDSIAVFDDAVEGILAL